MNISLNLFDIGASGKPNKYIKALASLADVNCKTYLVEPSQFMDVCKIPGATTLPFAVGRRSREAILWDPEVGGASLYQRNNDVVYRYVDPNAFKNKEKKQLVQLTSFSDAIRDLPLDSIDALKVDTQGSELEILEGVDDCGLIDSCFLVEVEIPSIPASYKNQPLMSDVIKFFEKKDFWLGYIKSNDASDRSHSLYPQSISKLDIFAINTGAKKRAMDIDCIFFRNPYAVIGSNDSKKIVKYALVIAAWGFSLEALSIIGEARNLGLITKDESAELSKTIRNLCGSPFAWSKNIFVYLLKRCIASSKYRTKRLVSSLLK